MFFFSYFAQILEASGPLDPEDPLLVGQLDNFSPDAQNSIRDAGGLQTFLLQSRHFIWVGSCIALAEPVAALPQAEGGASLDQLDDLEYPNMYTASPFPHAPAFTSYSPGYFSAMNGVHSDVLNTRHYVYPFAPPPDVTYSFTQPAVTESGLSSEVANIDTQQLSPYLVYDDEEVDLYSSVDNIVENGLSISSVADEETVLSGPAAVQVNTTVSPWETAPMPKGELWGAIRLFLLFLWFHRRRGGVLQWILSCTSVLRSSWWVWIFTWYFTNLELNRQVLPTIFSFLIPQGWHQ